MVVSCSCFDAVFGQPFGNLVKSVSLQILPKNAFYNFCFLFVNNQITIIIFVVAKESLVVDDYLSLLIAVLQTETHVLRKTFTSLAVSLLDNMFPHTPKVL